MKTDMLDEDVYAYIMISYLPEQANELLRSFEILYGFNLEHADSAYLNLISQSQTMDRDDMKDYFVTMLMNDMIKLINEHGIRINSDTRLTALNEIGSGLLLIQHLNDYSQLHHLLGSEEDPVEVICDVLAEVSTMTSTQFMFSITDIDDTVIPGMMRYIESKMQHIAPGDDLTPMADRLKVFKEFTDGHESLGSFMLAKGIPAGLNIQDYVTHIKIEDYHQTDLSKLALDLLSVLLMAKDTYNLPVIGYRKLMNYLVLSLDWSSRIEVLLSRINTDFETFLMASRQGA